MKLVVGAVLLLAAILAMTSTAEASCVVVGVPPSTYIVCTP